jgi:hypothetical protein
VHRHFVGGATPAERNVIGGNQIGVHISVAGTEHKPDPSWATPCGEASVMTLNLPVFFVADDAHTFLTRSAIYAIMFAISAG